MLLGTIDIRVTDMASHDRPWYGAFESLSTVKRDEITLTLRDVVKGGEETSRDYACLLHPPVHGQIAEENIECDLVRSSILASNVICNLS